jgi:hypothetical protein
MARTWTGKIQITTSIEKEPNQISDTVVVCAASKPAKRCAAVAAGSIMCAVRIGVGVASNIPQLPYLTEHAVEMDIWALASLIYVVACRHHRGGENSVVEVK